MQNSETTETLQLQLLKALSNGARLQVLDWLKDPVTHFPPQVDGDLLQDGVCADHLRSKLGIGAAAASRHLTLLTDVGLLVATRKKGWTFYQRNEEQIRAFAQHLHHHL